MSTRSALVGAFLLGGVTGAGATWMFAVTGERWRRVRHDLKAAKKGTKTLRTMLRRNLGDLVKAALSAAVVVGVLVVLVTR